MIENPKLTKLVDKAIATMGEESPSDSFIGAAMLVVEVRDSGGETAFYAFCTDKRAWIQAAILKEAGDALRFSEAFDDDD